MAPIITTESLLLDADDLRHLAVLLEASVREGEHISIRFPASQQTLVQQMLEYQSRKLKQRRDLYG